MAEHLLWDKETGDVYGESVLFTAEGTATLTFPATRIKAVRHPLLDRIYREGSDYNMEPGGQTLRRLPESQIPFLDSSFLYPAQETARLYPDPAANAIDRSSFSPTGLLGFDGKDFFARHQVEIDYVTSATLPEAASYAGNISIPEQPKLLFIGDSITDGWNATAKVGVPPFHPAWPRLVADAVWGKDYPLCNAAVSGSGSVSGPEHLKNGSKESIPSLLFIAYGMNDLARLSPKEFRRNIEDILQAGKALSVEMQFVLVSQMPGNPEWDLTPAGKDCEFARILREIAEESARTLYAPVNELFHALLGGKKYPDITGNGVNHPNDYGHRVYAAAVTAALQKS